MQPRPISLTDEQLQTIMNCAEPLHPTDRGRFLEAVAARLRGCEIGDGAVSLACREIARMYFKPPAIEHPPQQLARKVR
jgi:hypothetical protein